MNLVYSNSLTKLFSLIFYYFITNVYFNSNVKIMKVVWLITGWLLIVNKCIFQNFSLLFLFCFQTVTSFLFQKIVTFHKCKLDKECERERERGGTNHLVRHYYSWGKTSNGGITQNHRRLKLMSEQFFFAKQKPKQRFTYERHWLAR